MGGYYSTGRAATMRSAAALLLQHSARAGRAVKGVDIVQDEQRVQATFSVTEKCGLRALHVLGKEFLKGQSNSCFYPKSMIVRASRANDFFVWNDRQSGNCPCMNGKSTFGMCRSNSTSTFEKQ
jgi:hypothetical protein